MCSCLKQYKALPARLPQGAILLGSMRGRILIVLEDLVPRFISLNESLVHSTFSNNQAQSEKKIEKGMTLKTSSK